MTLKKQLVISLFLVGLIPFLAMGIGSYFKSAEALEKEGFSKLEIARELKKHELQTYVTMIDAAITTLGESDDVSELSNMLIEELKRYNVSGTGRYDITDKHEVRKIFNDHKQQFTNFINNNKLYDMFIIGEKYGHVMYSVTEESDLGENLSVGPLKNSGLAKAWRDAVSTGRTSFSDMEPYAPSNGDPAMFMATPIKRDGRIISVVAVQLSLEVINSIMGNRTGMGESGETYLVGRDLKMRSDSFLDPKNHTVLASFANPSLGSVKTDATSEAFAGKTDTKIIIDYNGNPVLSSYTPVKFFGVTWALIAEIDESEIFAPVYDLRNTALILGGIFFTAIIVFAFFLGNMVTKPIVSAVESITEGSTQVVSASDEIASAATSLADGSTEQASSVEEVSATVEESTAIINQASENAREADILAKGANEAAEEGNKKVKDLMVSMEKTTEASEQISKIIKTIDEIAFQTNLLALNAAVEAARAGEHGLGFAVVADEVKNLAGRSANAAKETTIIIEEAINQIKNGNEIAQATNESFGLILDRAKKTSNLIGEIAVSSQEQAEGMSQISSAMANIDEITQQNAATSEESAAAAEQLNAQSISMMESVTDIAKIVGLDVNEVATRPRGSSTRKATKAPIKQIPQAPAKQRTRATKAAPTQKSSGDIFPLHEDDLKEF